MLWRIHGIGFNELLSAPGNENLEVVSEINEDEEDYYGQEDYYDQEYYSEEYYGEEYYGEEYYGEYDEEYG